MSNDVIFGLCPIIGFYLGFRLWFYIDELRDRRFELSLKKHMQNYKPTINRESRYTNTDVHNHRPFPFNLR